MDIPEQNARSRCILEYQQCNDLSVLSVFRSQFYQFCKVLAQRACTFCRFAYVHSLAGSMPVVAALEQCFYMSVPIVCLQQFLYLLYHIAAAMLCW